MSGTAAGAEDPVRQVRCPECGDTARVVSSLVDLPLHGDAFLPVGRPS